MNSETIVMCVVALILGMLLANMLKSVCGCKTVEGQGGRGNPVLAATDGSEWKIEQSDNKGKQCVQYEGTLRHTGCCTVFPNTQGC